MKRPKREKDYDVGRERPNNEDLFGTPKKREESAAAPNIDYGVE